MRLAQGLRYINPDSKVHGANMGPIWVLSAPDGPHVGPMAFAIRACLQWYLLVWSRVIITSEKSHWEQIFTSDESFIAGHCIHFCLDLDGWVILHRDTYGIYLRNSAYMFNFTSSVNNKYIPNTGILYQTRTLSYLTILLYLCYVYWTKQMWLRRSNARVDELHMRLSISNTRVNLLNILISAQTNLQRSRHSVVMPVTAVR